MARTRSRRLLAAATATAGVVALGGPALADSIGVQLQALPAGSRSFAVTNLDGSSLNQITFSRQGLQPFRTTVTDNAWNLTNAGQDYSVAATMTNLYRTVNGAIDYNNPVPSSDLSLQYGTSPLKALGLSIGAYPSLSVAGTIGSCASLVNTTLGNALGLTALNVGTLAGLPTAVVNLCTDLGVAGGSLAGTVDGVLKSVTPTFASLADLPNALTGGTPGAFSVADYTANPVAAGDPHKVSGVTSLPIMHGANNATAALSTVTSTLKSLLLNQAPTAGTSVGNVLAGLMTTGDATTSKLATDLSLLTGSQQATAVGTLHIADVTSSVLGNLNAEYDAFPILKAAPSSPVSGTYDGTMTVTFLQQ